MAGIDQFKCPACGGNIEFDANIQKMKCPYCDTEFDMESVLSKEEAVGSETVDEIQWDEGTESQWSEEETADMVVYACSSCGGEIVCDENMGASTCPYCGSQVVMSGRFSGALKPDYIIPFKLDAQKAKDSFLDFVKGKKFTPKQFKSTKHIEEMKGVYVPFWLFDAEIEGDVTYTVVFEERTECSSYTDVEEETYEMYREGTLSFRNIPVDGSSKIADDLMESIEPFDFQEAVPFSKAYLAGFLADKYDVGKDTSIDRAKERMKTSTELAFMGTITGTPRSSHTSSSHIDVKKCKAKYVLYPVWMLSGRYGGEAYTFAVNGQTGKFAGNLPVDNGALWKYFAKVTGIVTAIVYALAMAALFI